MPAHKNLGLQSTRAILLVPSVQLLEIAADLGWFFKANDLERGQDKQVPLELGVIKGFDLFIPDLAIPEFEFMDKKGKHLIRLHIGMMTELIQVNFRQIGSRKELGHLLCVQVALVFVDDVVD